MTRVIIGLIILAVIATPIWLISDAYRTRNPTAIRFHRVYDAQAGVTCWMTVDQSAISCLPSANVRNTTVTDARP